ncbi:hypothetical protein ACP70R_011790 [Stipagrostis hirtigluma subsp. patula]
MSGSLKGTAGDLFTAQEREVVVTKEREVDTAWELEAAEERKRLAAAADERIMEAVRARGGTAHQALLGIEHQFLGNREQRALHLNAELRIFVQGDLSVSDYCRKMKSMADSLINLDKNVHDRTLVINILRGLNEKFDVTKAFFKRARPFLTFQQVRDELLLEELTMPKQPPSAASALFANAPKGSGAPLAPASAAPGPPAGGSSSGGGKGSATNAGSDRHHHGKGGNGGKGGPPWPSFYSP